MIKPVVDRISSDHDLDVMEVDTEDQVDIAQLYGVMSVPTLILIADDGQELARHTGMNTTKTVEANLKLDGTA